MLSGDILRNLNEAENCRLKEGDLKRYKVSFYVDTDSMNNMDIEEAVEELLKNSGLASTDETIDVEIINEDEELPIEVTSEPEESVVTVPVPALEPGDTEIVKALIGEEEDAVVSYSEKAEKVTNESLKQLFQHIQEEEQEHINELGKALSGKIDF